MRICYSLLFAHLFSRSIHARIPIRLFHEPVAVRIDRRVRRQSHLWMSAKVLIMQQMESKFPLRYFCDYYEHFHVYENCSDVFLCYQLSYFRYYCSLTFLWLSFCSIFFFVLWKLIASYSSFVAKMCLHIRWREMQKKESFLLLFSPPHSPFFLVFSLSLSLPLLLIPTPSLSPAFLPSLSSLSSLPSFSFLPYPPFLSLSSFQPSLHPSWREIGCELQICSCAFIFAVFGPPLDCLRNLSVVFTFWFLYRPIFKYLLIIMEDQDGVKTGTKILN